MGLVRHLEDQDRSCVRLWVAPISGIILCADERFGDNFGITSADIAGRPFSSLGPDMETLERCVEGAGSHCTCRGVGQPLRAWCRNAGVLSCRGQPGVAGRGGTRVPRPCTAAAMHTHQLY